MMRVLLSVLLLLAAAPAWAATPVSDAPAPKGWPTQEACEQATGRQCDFVMCDHIPEGKNIEDVCGKDFRKGWQPVPEQRQAPQQDGQ